MVLWMFCTFIPQNFMIDKLSPKSLILTSNCLSLTKYVIMFPNQPSLLKIWMETTSYKSSELI